MGCMCRKGAWWPWCKIHPSLGPLQPASTIQADNTKPKGGK